MLFSMATMWYVLGETHSTLSTAGVVLIPLLTQLLVSQAFATLADRLSKKAAMVGSDVFRGLVVLIVGMLMALHHAGTLGIYMASFLLTMAGFLFGPPQNAALPKMLSDPERQMPKANSVLSATSNITNLTGYAVGGMIVAVVHPVNAVFLDGLSFLLSATSIAILRVSTIRSKGQRGALGFIKDSLAGIRFIWERPALRTFGLYVTLINFVVGPVGILSVVFSRVVLHAGLRGYGFLEASWAVGGVVGAVVSSWASKRFRMWQLLLMGLVGSGVALTSMPVFANLPESIFALVIASVVITLMNIPFFTALQLLAPDEIRGRVMAAFGLFAGVGDPLGLFVGSWLMGRVSPSTVFLSSGLLVVVCGIVGVCFPVIRKGETQFASRQQSDSSKIAESTQL